MSHIEQAEFFNDYESLKNDPETFLYNYFAMIINEVDLRRETLKQDIDNYSDSIIEEIERTRADCYKIGEQWQIFLNSRPKNTLLYVKTGKKVYFLVHF